MRSGSDPIFIDMYFKYMYAAILQSSAFEKTSPRNCLAFMKMANNTRGRIF